MLKRILCVDDEPNILLAMERQFRKLFEIHTAAGPHRGLEALAQQGPFAVVVSDLRMPGMSGVEFLTRVRAASPDTVRVMLTGQADLEAAVAAVNQGNIFRFLTKPCPVETLAQVLTAALEQHRLITSERELLEQTLRSSIGVMSEILSLVNPAAFGRAVRIRRYVVHMAERLALPDRWQFELAALLSQIGSVTVPAEVMDKYRSGEPLTPDETQILAAQSRVGYELLARIPRLETVARMVARQDDRWGHAPGKPDAAIVGGHLLKIARDFDEQVILGADSNVILTAMRRNRDYNPDLVAALQEIQIEESQRLIRLVTVAQLRTGMIISGDVRCKNGLLLYPKGQEITDSAMARLKSFAQTIGLVEPLSVMVPDAAEDAEDKALEAYSIGSSVTLCPS